MLIRVKAIFEGVGLMTIEFSHGLKSCYYFYTFEGSEAFEFNNFNQT